MTLMGEGLKKVAGSSLELILSASSSTPLKGLLLGAGVTGVIQSSAATSVMVGALVNSGMMKFKQAISSSFGALIGTSVTGWIICLQVWRAAAAGGAPTATISAIVAVIGWCCACSARTRRSATREISCWLCRFDVRDAVHERRCRPCCGRARPLSTYFTTFSNPALGILAGAAFTAVLQSASAAVGILQALRHGRGHVRCGLPDNLGIAVGAAVPVLLSALGARASTAHTAVSYLVAELTGAVFCALVFYSLDAVFDFQIKIRRGGHGQRGAAQQRFPHGDGLCAAAVHRPDGKSSSAPSSRKATRSAAPTKSSDRLDERFLEHPALAVEQSRLTVNSMAQAAKENLLNAVALLGDYTAAGFEKVERTEELVDQFEDKLGTYLVKLTALELTEEQSERVSKYLHALSDFERISDHAVKHLRGRA